MSNSTTAFQTNSFKSRGVTRVAALCCVFIALTSGCKQQVLCPALGSCGGPNPDGTWALTPANAANPAHGSCTEDLYVPASDPRLAMADQPAARTPPPEPALYDWCDNLVTSGGNNVLPRAARFFYESGPVGDAVVRFQDFNGTFGHYSAGITKTGTYTLDFPTVCMREFGAMDGKPAYDPNQNALVGPPVSLCKQIEPSLSKAGIGEGSFRNVTCDANPADPGGCLCRFDASETGGGTGIYQPLSGNTLLLLPETNFPQKVTYCNKGVSLDLTGANGDYLFGQRGLRTFDLAKINCSDGVQGLGEEGVDCGGACPMPCAAATPPPAAP